MSPASAAIDAGRLWSSLMTMAEIGKTPGGGVRRLALSDEDRAGRDRLAEWLAAAGLAVRVDDLGNMYGRRAGTDAGAAPVVFGSHLDTVPTGGRFDGVLGVMGALEVVRALGDAGIRTRAPLEVVNWTNEEGARFAPAMLASGVVCGRFTREEAYASRDGDGRMFGDELARIGYRGETAHRLCECAAYLELHVEQGPVLERARRQVGVVEGIEGISWNRIEVTGRAAHAGPTPTPDRRDALVAAAKLVLLARDAAEHLDGVRTTVGRVEVSPNTINVVPGRVEMTLDVRSPCDAGLDEALRAADEACRAVCAEGDRGGGRRRGDPRLQRDAPVGRRRPRRQIHGGPLSRRHDLRAESRRPQPQRGGVDAARGLRAGGRGAPRRRARARRDRVGAPEENSPRRREGSSAIRSTNATTSYRA